MIHYLSYYRSDKNLGLALNERIESLYAASDDWIVINDMDVCYLTPNSGRQIEDIARKATHGTGLIGCLTNRVGVRRFLHKGQFSNEWDVRKHISTALELERDNWAKLTETNEVIPGYFMMFKKEVFDDVGGFEEGTTLADQTFNTAIDKLGYQNSSRKAYTYSTFTDRAYNQLIKPEDQQNTLNHDLYFNHITFIPKFV